MAPVETAPALQVYVDAPVAVKFAVCPAQIVGEFTVTTGTGLTEIVAMAVLLQPAVVPVTVYVVVIIGEAVAVFTPVDVAPALHVYVVAPPAVSVGVAPAQIVGEFIVTVGIALTVTVAIAVLLHPADVPVTVYEVVEVGEADAVFTPVDEAPALHVYVEAPPAVNVATCPLQIVGEFTVIVNDDATVTVATAVLVHPAADVPVTV